MWKWLKGGVPAKTSNHRAKAQNSGEGYGPRRESGVGWVGCGSALKSNTTIKNDYNNTILSESDTQVSESIVKMGFQNCYWMEEGPINSVVVSQKTTPIRF